MVYIYIQRATGGVERAYPTCDKYPPGPEGESASQIQLWVMKVGVVSGGQRRKSGLADYFNMALVFVWRDEEVKDLACGAVQIMLEDNCTEM